MTTPSTAKTLSTWDWIRMSAAQLKARNHEPEDRIHYCGHRTALPAVWVPSVGNWGHLDTRDLINSKETHLGLIRVKPGAYRQFKYTHGLMTRSEFEANHGVSIEACPWIFAELCWNAHERVQAEIEETNKTTCSFGEACAAIARLSALPDTPLDQRLGLLPVEVTLWARLFDVFRWHHVLADGEWQAMNDTDKAAHWVMGINGLEPTISLVAGLTARRHLRVASESLATAVG